MFKIYTNTCIIDHKKTFRVFGKLRTWWFYKRHLHPEV